MPLQFYSFAFFPYPAVNHDCKALLEARAIKASGCECSAVPYQRNDPYDAILFAKRDIERDDREPLCNRDAPGTTEFRSKILYGQSINSGISSYQEVCQCSLHDTKNIF